MHFWEVVARVYARFSRPRNRSLNWFIPAFVNSSVGSSAGTSGELGTMRWPFFLKYSRKDDRISFDVMVSFYKTGANVRFRDAIVRHRPMVMIVARDSAALWQRHPPCHPV